MTSELSLREHKKQTTRAALSHAAWSLMVQHGLDAATPEAIAEAANVSPRTFRNYFTSREEAILDATVQRGTVIVDALRARPATEPLWDSLTQILPSVAADFVGERTDVAVLMGLIRNNPGMRAQHLVTYEYVHQRLAELIAERTDTDAQRDIAPRLLAAAVSIVLRTSVEIWALGKTRATLSDLIGEGLAQLRDGLPLGAVKPVDRHPLPTSP